MSTISLRDKVQALYDVINTEFYYARESLEVKEGIRYEPVALFSIFTCILEGKQFLEGGYGKGKTTSCERIGSVIYGLPLEFILLSELHCHAEVTEDKSKGILDLGALQKKGEEQIIWHAFLYNPVKLLEEVNRLTRGQQTILLNEVDRNIWTYRGHTLMVPYGCLFVTMNASDPGNTELLYALRDRNDVSVQVKKPGILRSRAIRKYWNTQDKLLADEGLALEMLDFLMHKENRGKEKEKFEYVTKKSDEFKKELESRIRMHLMSKIREDCSEEYKKKFGKLINTFGIPASFELEQIRNEINGVKVDKDVDFVLDYVANKIDFCQYGKKEDFRRCGNCHYKGHTCARMEQGGERLFGGSAPKYSKALAWLLGDGMVTVEHLRAVLPNLLQHRVKLNPTYLQEVDKKKRFDGTWTEFLAVEMAVEKMIDEQNKIAELQKKLYNALTKKDVETAEEIMKKSGNELLEHPVLIETLLDLGIKVEPS